MRTFEEKANLFKAFCDSTRQQILSFLKDGELCGCMLIEKTGLAQSKLSYHMQILMESGIVNGREEGKWTHYSINNNACEEAIRVLNELKNG